MRDRESEAALEVVAEGQLGLITRGDARALGVSEDWIDRRIVSGEYHSLFPGVLRHAGSPETADQYLLAACLASNGLASHRSAASMRNLAGIAPPPMPEITRLAVGGRPRVAGVLGHTTGWLPPSHITVVRGVPCTTVARTLVDVGRYVTPYVIADALDDAIRRGLCRAGEVAEIADARAGERGTAGIRRVLDRVLTEPEDVRYRLERETLRAIRAAGFEVVAQFAVEVDGEDYVIDFAIPHLMVGLEVKGWEPRRTRTAFDRDAEREAALRSIGWMLLPVTSRTKMPTLVRRLRRIALLSSRTANLPADGQGKLAVHAEGGRLRGAGTMA